MRRAQSMTERQPLAGRAFAAEWPILFHIGFSFEVPTRRIAGLLPAGVEAVEPLPGVALLNLLHARHAPSSMGGARPYDEVVASILVQPDLSLSMPLPRLTLYVLKVLSNSKSFVDYKVPALKMPVHYEPSLGSELRADRMGCEVRDARGPIFSLASTSPSPVFKERAFTGQYFAQPEPQHVRPRGSLEGGVHHGVWRWAGPLFETQKAERADYTLHAHPLFDELGLGEIGASRCFMQQVGRPGARVHMWTYQTRLFARA